VATVSALREVLEATASRPCEVIVVATGRPTPPGRLGREAGAGCSTHRTTWATEIAQGRDRGGAARHHRVSATPTAPTPPQSVPGAQWGVPPRVRHGGGRAHGAALPRVIFKAPLRELLRAIVEFTANRKIPDINSGSARRSAAPRAALLPHLCDTFLVHDVDDARAYNDEQPLRPLRPDRSTTSAGETKVGCARLGADHAVTSSRPPPTSTR
jgi:hypothetical protein